MEKIQSMNRVIATIGNGALLIWWGVVILIDPLTLGMGAIGSGLIMLGVNVVRLLMGIPTKPATTIVGSISLAWGAVDTIFNPNFGASFAILIIIIGLATIATLLAPHPTDQPAT